MAKKTVTNSASNAKEEFLWKLFNIDVDYSNLTVMVTHSGIIDFTKFKLNEYINSIEFDRGSLSDTTTVKMNGPLSLAQIVSFINDHYIKTITA